MVGVPGSNPGVSTKISEVNMFEINIFNSAQIFDQIFAFICVYLLTSLNAKTRFYGFIIGTVGFIPGCLLYTSPSPRDIVGSRMPSSA